MAVITVWFVVAGMAGNLLAAEPGPLNAAQEPAVKATAPLTATVEGAVYLDRIVDEDTYRVGPGDVITINTLGPTPKSFDLTVTPEATVVIPMIGVVNVRNLTLHEMRGKLLSTLREFYPRGELTVSLTKLRRFRVTVSGDVGRPGLYVVTANTRASEVLAEAGLGGQAARRSIELRRPGGTLRVDLTVFERLGRREANPYLMEGDVLLVRAQDPRWGTVEVSGAVNAPGRFEFVEGERVSDLIALAYGLARNADTTRVELWRFSAGDSLAGRVVWPAHSTYSQWLKASLTPDDHLVVRGYRDYHRRMSVTIAGEVLRPGTYVFPGPKLSLRTLIDSAGGFTPEADLANAQIRQTVSPLWEQDLKRRIRGTPEKLRSQLETDWLQAEALSVPGRISTDFVRLFDNGEIRYDVMLSDGDIVNVPRRTAFVNVIGRVVRPGMVTYVPAGDINYYLKNVGGYSWRANRGGTFLIKGGTGAAVKRGNVRSIEAGDIIVVPTKRKSRIWQRVRETIIVAANVATVYLVIDQATR